MSYTVSLRPPPSLLPSNQAQNASWQCNCRFSIRQADGHSVSSKSWRQSEGRSTILFPWHPKPRQRAHRWTLSAPSFATTSGRPQVSRAYTRVAECLVFPNYARPRKPRGLVHFIGGAFIGAVPEVTYSLFIELLTKQDFLIIATPYNVTFEHEVAAQEVHRKFRNCRAILIEGGFSPAGLTSEDIARLPLFSIGHSNGALLQLLIGCIVKDDLPKANAVIAFNNKPAADAVPYFEQLGPLVTQLTPIIATSPLVDLSRSLSGDSLKGLLDVASPMLPNYDEESIRSLQNFTEQIPSVLDQISRGMSEFTPAPFENRGTIANGYEVQDTLLVKYKVDAIDESDIIEDVLRPRIEKSTGSLSKLTVNGNHITPCVQDIKWEVGKIYTPVDAVGQVLRSVALSDIRETVISVSNWFEKFL